MSGNKKNRAVRPSSISFEIAQKPVNFFLRLGWERNRIESKVGSFFHIDDKTPFQPQVGQGIESLIGFRIQLTEPALKLAQLAFDSAGTIAETSNLILGLS